MARLIIAFTQYAGMQTAACAGISLRFMFHYNDWKICLLSWDHDDQSGQGKKVDLLPLKNYDAYPSLCPYFLYCV